MPNSPQNELAIVLEAAGAAPITDHAFLRVTGIDAARWLNGMVSNAVQTLAPGEGCYNFLLNAQGRIQGDCTVYRETSAEPAEFLLATTAAQVDAIRQHLDHFIIMDDVELTPAHVEEFGLLILGEDAAAALGTLGLPAVDPLRLVHADTEHGPVLLLSPAAGLVPKVELRAAAATMDGLRGALTLPEVSAETLEFLRLLEARPLFGQDIRNTETARDLPQETAQTHALHFAKGCYLGQEIVERIRSRGQVHRQFMAFRLTGELPATLPAPLEAGGKPAGELTSAALVPLAEGPTLVGLGYARQEALDIGQASGQVSGLAGKPVLTYTGGVAIPHRVSPPTV
jgi:folate-binding protein YgfZ